MSNEWKAQLLIAASMAHAEGVSDAEFVNFCQDTFDEGLPAAPNYTVDHWGRMLNVQAMIELDSRYRHFAFHCFIPENDGMQLDEVQVGNIMMNSQVSRKGTPLAAFMMGFDSLEDKVSWRVSLKREPPEDGYGPWKNLGTFEDLVTIPVRFTSLAEMVSYFRVNPPHQLSRFIAD